MATSKIIAHRGAWKNNDLPQNSIAALKKAKKIGCDGCELDVHLTADGVVVVNHDHDFYGTSIEKSTYTQLCSIKHANGETIPTLEEFLSHAAIPLVLEIKASAIGAQRSLELTSRTLATVEESTFNESIIYISFSEEILTRIRLEDPSATVLLLNGKLDPAQIKAKNWQGFDYSTSVLHKNSQWMAEAQELDLLTNVWTVNDTEDMHLFLDAKIDFITTDEPEMLLNLSKSTF